MPYDKKISIASPEEVHSRVDALKYRSDEIKGRLAEVFINLWNPERILKGVDPGVDFSRLEAGFPHFREVIENVSNSVFVSSLTESPFHMGPTLLLGDPGLGKTFFVKQLADLLGLPYFEISFATTTASFVLSGGNLQWGEADAGEIARILSKSEYANPIVLLDEVDKCRGSNHYDPSNVLYNLLEPHTARRFKDESIALSLDASNVIWVATANYKNRIADPILSRMRVFEIPQPAPEEMRSVVATIYSGFLEHKPYGKRLEKQIDGLVMDTLCSLSPRAVRLVIEEAALRAVRRGSSLIEIEDLPASERKERHRVGFI